MSFTTVDAGFSSERYSFDGPDFGSWDVDVRIPDVAHRVERCASCAHDEVKSFCVARADYALIQSASLTNSANPVFFNMPNLAMMTDTMGGGDGDVPDSVGGEDGDVPDSIGGEDDEDESNDDDTESERM